MTAIPGKPVTAVDGKKTFTVLRSLNLSVLLASLPFGMLLFGLPLIAREMGANALAIGGLLSVYALIIVAVQPVGIQQHIGRRPIAAFGNSDGDLEMLDWVTSGAGLRFGLLIHHDDAAREFAYDRVAVAGKFDGGLDEAPRRGWTLVSMKRDWKQVFAFEND